MKHALAILIVCALGCESTQTPASDATIDRVGPNETSVSDVASDSGLPYGDASMDSNFGADVPSDASNSADAHD